MQFMENNQPFYELADLQTIVWEDVCGPPVMVNREKFHAANEVHVWQSTNESAFSQIPDLFNPLSIEEKRKVQNLKFLRDQTRYVYAHGTLRLILAAYAAQAPSQLTYAYTKYGKPVLAGQPDKNKILFNMTHAENTVCCIVSSRKHVGIDLEQLNYGFDWLSIAKQYFTAQELIYLGALPSDKQIHPFYFIWTRKEALLKALGWGLTGIERLDSVLSDFYQKYALASFLIDRNFQCSLAVHSGVSRIRFFRLAVE